MSLCAYEESQGIPRARILLLALHFRIGTTGVLPIQSLRSGRVLTRDSQRVASLLDKKLDTTYIVYARSQATAGEYGHARVGSGRRLKLLLHPRQRATTILVSVVHLEGIAQKRWWFPSCAKFIKHAKNVKQKISITDFRRQYDKRNDAGLAKVAGMGRTTLCHSDLRMFVWRGLGDWGHWGLGTGVRSLLLILLKNPIEI